jgi:hypothetical protein
MGATLANPSLHPRFRGRGRTAFERNLLPGFAHWMIEQLERREPDYLVPVETKGARVLEAVMRYARDELGEPLGIPVIYASALAFMDPESLREKQVMVVDDSVQSGDSLRRQRTRIERFGPTVIQSLACVGDASKTHPEVDCYRNLEPGPYRETIWQLAELVVARGLPPEVDHHLFELRLPGGLEPSWWTLRALLSPYGTLTIDGPEIEGKTLQPLTLHFPELPGARGSGGTGPHKLRFFFDPASDCIYVVPVSFPPISLPAPDDASEAEPEEWRYPAAVAEEALASVIGPGPSIGDTLIEQARVFDPETIFATVSTTAEFELIRGLQGLLDRVLPGSSIQVEGEQFHRLYGDAAEPIVAAVRGGLRTAPAGGEPPWPDLAAIEASEKSTPFLDRTVGEQTRELAAELQQMYERARARDPKKSRRVGMSMQGLTEFLGGDPLFGSRCVDYGLSMTTLVPFVSLERQENAVLLERCYRVSERRSDERTPFEDMSQVREALSCEMVAEICHCIAERSDRYRGQPLEEDLLASLVGVLSSMVCADHSIELKAMPCPEGQQIVLCSDDHALTLLDHDPKQMLLLDGETVRPSQRFEEMWRGDGLRLKERNSTEDIEEHVCLLIEFLDDLEPTDHERLLSAWAMCTDMRLGLTHVRSSLNAALAEMTKALNLVLRGEDHSPTSVDVNRYVEAVRDKLEALDHDWAAEVWRRWKDPSKPPPLQRQERILDSLGAPRAGTGIYELPALLATLVEVLAPLAEQLNMASARLWDDEASPGDAAIPAVVFQACAMTRNALSSFEERIEAPSPPADPRESLVAAAEELLDLIERVRAFGTACAGLYRGSLEDHLSRPGENKRSVSVLSLDLIGSSEHGRLHNKEEHRKWVNGGLNVAGQWSRAFTGREGDRVGDEVWTEFTSGDAPVLAAAAVLQHSLALSSTNLEEASWGFHAGVDFGELEDERPTNVISHTMDRVTQIAKKCDPQAVVNAIYISPESFKTYSAELQEMGLESRCEEIDLAGDPIRPLTLAADGLMAAFHSRIDQLLPKLRELQSEIKVDNGPLNLAEAPEEVVEEASSTTE